MKKNKNNLIALFPGKFQPPHLGHVLTILRINSNYDKVVVAITEDKPEVMSQLKRKQIFNEVFKGYPNIKIITVKGTIEGCNSLIHLPNFDVCISGNKKVIKKIREFGKKAKFTKRSFSELYSGTKIRRKL